MPGIVETPENGKSCGHEKARTKGTTYEEEYADYVAEMALKRVTTPDDVANAVVFLACDDSKNITGQEWSSVVAGPSEILEPEAAE